MIARSCTAATARVTRPVSSRERKYGFASPRFELREELRTGDHLERRRPSSGE
jgi:hypothetical protein